jgi:hypothetical protein
VTTSTSPRHAWVDVIDLEDTVTIHRDPVGEQTQRLFPIPRDTDRTPRSAFAMVDPATTASLPALAGLAAELGRRAELAAAARINTERQAGPGRHREPSLFGRLFGRGRRDGV